MSRFTLHEVARGLNEFETDPDEVATAITALVDKESVSVLTAFSLLTPSEHPLGRASDIINGIRLGVRLADAQYEAALEVEAALEDAGLA